MTDNGSAYVSGAFATAVAALGAVHKRTKPYTPQTNGKAERLIQTLLRSWAYVRPYQHSAERTEALPPWLDCTTVSEAMQDFSARHPSKRYPRLPGTTS
jgi:transposase InsO family protein